MADSDDELDRRNVREKFRHERNDYDRRDSRGRHVPAERGGGSRSRDRHGDGDRSRRDRPSSQPKRDSPPPVKRVRREVDDGSSYPPNVRVPYGSGGPMHAGPPPHGAGWGHGAGDVHGAHSFHPGPGDSGDIVMQPPMMNLKQFIASQDENLTDSEAAKRYAEYRDTFRRQQINEFFTQHKEEEWFRSKYHPDEHDRRQEEARGTLKHRCRVFMKLLQLGRLSGVSLDIDQTKELVRVLDAAVILMEGGTEFDLKAIDLEETAVTEVTTPRKRDDSESQATRPVSVVRKVSMTSEGEICVTAGVATDNTDKISDKSIDSPDEDEHPKFTEPLRLENDSKPLPVAPKVETLPVKPAAAPAVAPIVEKVKKKKVPTATLR